MERKGSINITFNPNNNQNNFVLQRFTCIKEYYITSSYDFHGDEKVSQTILYDAVPLHLIASVKKRLELSDYQYSIELY
jgi:hypothetical protein